MLKGLRHVGFKVRDLEASQALYEALGWKQLQPVETIRLLKLISPNGDIIEMIEGDSYDPHIAVTWARDPDGNLIEIVEEDKCIL